MRQQAILGAVLALGRALAARSPRYRRRSRIAVHSRRARPIG